MKQSPRLSQLTASQQLPISKSSTLQLPSLYTQNHNKQSQMLLSSPKMNASKVSTFSKTTICGFEQRLMEKIGVQVDHESYQNSSTADISKQCVILKDQLKHMSQQLDKLIESRNFTGTIKMKSSSSSMLLKSHFITQSTSKLNTKDENHGQIYEEFQKNNSKILLNNSLELGKLLERQSYILKSTNPNGLMEQLKRNIQKTKQELKEQKKNCKQMLLSSQKTGNDILQTDDLIEEIRALEKEFMVVTLRKRKLQEQTTVNKERQRLIDSGKEGIFDKEYELDEYESDNKKKVQLQKKQAELYSESVKKQRIICALKRDKEAREKIMAKSYFELLSELNEVEKRSQEFGQRYDNLQQKIGNSTVDYENKRQQHEKLMQKRESLIKNRGFLTEIQNVEKKEIDSSKSKMSSSMAGKRDSKDLLKEVEENLQKTLKNLDVMEKQSENDSRRNSLKDHSANQKQKVRSSIISHNSKDYRQPLDSQILEQQEDAFEDEQITEEQREERFKEQEFEDRIGEDLQANI